jgi:hypothetical protein
VGETSVKGGAALDWDDAAARARFLAELVADADRLLEQVRVARGALAAGSPEEAALVEAAGLLSRVLCQDVERKATGPAIMEGTAPDRLVSVHDPEVRHGRKSASKRFEGHKAAVAVDTDTQLITAVDVLAGNAPDATGALALVEQSEAATECAVEETCGDCAYGDGATRQAFAAADRVLHAPVPAFTNQGRFPKAAFRIDPGAAGGPSCTCPGGQTTTATVPHRGAGRLFVFAAPVCAACPLRGQCLKDPERPRRRTGRTVLLHPQEALLQAARAFQHSPAFAAVRRRRQTAEHRLARLVQLGIRQARYVGRPKTRAQLLLAATVANLTLLAHAEAATAGATALAVAVAALTVLAATSAPALARVVAPRGRGRPTGHPGRGLLDPVLYVAASRRMHAFRPDF